MHGECLQDLQSRGPDLSLIRDGYSGELTNAIARMMSPSEVLRPAALDVLNWEWLRMDIADPEMKELGMIAVVSCLDPVLWLLTACCFVSKLGPDCAIWKAIGGSNVMLLLRHPATGLLP
mmetsp:Transcript_44919/g.85883  ORF Transcript_44919/g.85883 Transcript_44919/m.85883 type:complete len:120 (+) Transcript_44919:106-465(+)